ncbi:MAG: hypothetical protein IPL28_00385 [Chloroflexi bacterium]|nr:hypothetical protein [Chloroflexota bacterium]
MDEQDLLQCVKTAVLEIEPTAEVILFGSALVAMLAPIQIGIFWCCWRACRPCASFAGL